MKYPGLKDGSREDRYNRLLSYKAWYKMFDTQGVEMSAVMTPEKTNEVKDILMKEHALDENRIGQLAIFTIYVDAGEIYAHYIRYLEFMKVDGRFGASLEKLVIRYGVREGTRRYQAARVRNSEKGKRGPRTKYFYMDRGYSEEEAIQKVSDLQRENTKKRTKESYQDHGKKIKISKQYFGYVGLTEDEVEDLRSVELAKISHDLESCISRYGEVEGPVRYLEIKAKRRKTKEDNYGDISFMAGAKGKASKESLKLLFDNLCSDIDNTYPELEYRIGRGENREYWLRTQENQYYFYDFVIPEIKLIVEYNGTGWHYRDDETWERYAILKDKKDQVKERDLDKVLLAETQGYNIIVVWSDEDMETRHKEIMCAIKERIDESFR